MRKLRVFNFITLNGFYKGPGGDISWHKNGGGEDEDEYGKQGVGAGGILMFGRVTYQMMAGFWPTEMAANSMPEMAEGMNKAEKIVFSKTLETADWNNTTIIKDNIIEEVSKMKQAPGKDMTILGSGSIISQFADAGLIDEYELIMDPLALGDGTSIFNGIKQQLNLQLTNCRTFKSGAVVLSYHSM